MKKTLFITFFSLAITQISYAQKGDYKLELSKVELQGKVTGDSSNIKVDSLTITKGNKYSYSDQNIEINWIGSYTEFSFSLKNNTDQTIKIIWDDAAYINTIGNSNKVFHNGVKYIDRNNSQPASTIIKGASITDIIAPTENVYFSSGEYGGWNQLPLFIKPRKHSLPEFDNKQVRILLPLLVNGLNTEYIFTFKVKWAEEIKKKKSKS